MHRSLPKTLFSFILYFLRPYKLYALLFVGLASVSGLRVPMTSMLMKHIINVMPLIRAGTVGLLIWTITLIVLSFFVFDTVIWRLMTYLNYKFQPLIKNNIIRKTLNWVLGNSNAFFQGNLSGRISSQIITLADTIELMLHQISMYLIHGTSLLVISLITMHSVNAIFFYIMSIWFITFSIFSISMSKRLVSLSDAYASSESSVSGQLVDSITNHNNVRMFAKKNYEINRLGPYLLGRQKAFQANELLNLIVPLIQGCLITLMIGGNAYYLVHLYIQGSITIGDFSLIVGLSISLGHQMWFTMAQVSVLNQAIGKCKQSLAALMVESEVKDISGASDLLVTKGQIAFESVQVSL